MKNIFLVFFPFVFIAGCSQKSNVGMTVQDIEIFKNTPSWELVKAVEKDDFSRIKKILKKDKSLVNFQEPMFGTTVLMRAVNTEKYETAKLLLDYGADPNIVSNIGTFALFETISFSWKDKNANGNPKFVKLLLNYGANPNLTYCSPKIEGENDPIECGTSPLIHAVSRGMEKAKLLIQKGADINYKTKSGNTASYEALLMKDVDLAYFLIVEKNAKITDPVYLYSVTEDNRIQYENPHYPVDLLIDWVFELNSKEYKMKMEIVKKFEQQGINYQDRKNEISKLTLKRIKKMYPESWENYIDKY